jgi:hypothetical protein
LIGDIKTVTKVSQKHTENIPKAYLASVELNQHGDFVLSLASDPADKL